MRLRALGMWVNLLLASVLMLAVWVLLVWVGSRPALKRLIDMTPQQRSTIDPVSVDLLAGLAAQGITVEIHTFFERGAEARDPFQQQRQRILERLRELTFMLLRQYQFHGGEAVRIVNHDQYGDIPATREAVQRFGLTQTDVLVVAVEQSGRPPRHRTLSLEGDLGVVEIPELRVTQSPMPGATMPVLKDYRGEQAISSALKSLLVQGNPVIYFALGVSKGLSLTGPTMDGYLQLSQMLTSLGFTVRELPANVGAVPEDAALVAVLEPRAEFSASETRMLHEYLRRGGRMFVNYSYSAVDGWNPDGGELGRLLGYQVGPERVLHLIVDPRYGLDVRGLDGNERVGKLDLFPNVNHPITLRLARQNQALQMDAARPLRMRTDVPTGVRREDLLYTGPQAWLSRDNDFRAPQRGLANYLVGAVFELDGENDPAAAGAAKRDGVCVVVSGVFCNNLALEINASLAANIFNWLAERRVLMDIRGSSYVSRRLQVQPQQLDRIWWLLVVGVPAGFLLLGLFVGWRRRDR
ncbi:MAG: Gldg family protein [Planctomycetota bacterium]